MFSDVVIIIGDKDVPDVGLFKNVLFGVLRGMYEVKSFRLVFCLEVLDGDREETTRALKRRIGVEEVRGGLEFLPCPPDIVSDMCARPGPPIIRSSDGNGCLRLVPHAL